MAKHKRLLGLSLICFCVCGGFLLSALDTQSQDTKKKIPRPQAEEVDTSKFPIVDFLAPLPEDPKERAIREAKGKKYNDKSPPIDEQRDQIYAITDWEMRLSAFPIEKSAALIVGTIKKAKAHFSENRTNVYSEFEVQIDEVLKNDSALTVGSSVVVERAGGRVRFPSGKTMVSLISHQQMPQVGGQYLLFLTHDAPLGGVYEDYFILTGYEFRGDSVFPLDKLLPGHPISAYQGVDKNFFFTDLNSALSVARLPTR